MTQMPSTALFTEALPLWMSRQRWYRGGRTPALHRAGAVQLPHPDPDLQLWLHLLRDGDLTYLVPLSWRGTPRPDQTDALVASVNHARLGTRHVYDATQDPALAEALLALVVQGGDVASAPGAGQVAVTGEPYVAGAPSGIPQVSSMRVLDGEQSNTSMIIEVVGAPPVIAKLFRVLVEGDNPDVTVQTTLAQAGSTRVAPPVGSVRAHWLGRDGVPAQGHMAYLAEFLPHTRDAWREAVEAARTNRDYTAQARSLGSATAEVHHILRTAMPTWPADEAAVETLRASMSARLEQALRDAPDLAPFAASIKARYDALSVADLSALQRVHGDLHLGQVLDAPGRGWVLLDFEGEPMRPMAERTAPDFPARDVAGMLRSFDYAAGTAARDTGADRSDWSRACREAFLDGYGAGGVDVGGSLLSALEVDKALYEVSYEAANRPSWLPLPLTAIAALVGPPEPVPAPAPEPEPVPAPSAIQRQPLDESQAWALVAGTHSNPHQLLGAHPYGGGVTVRTLRRGARAVTVLLPDGSRHSMTHETEGIWGAAIPVCRVPDYRIGVDWGDGFEHVVDDPYRFLPTLGEVDVHLFTEGRHEQLWRVLGSHVRRYHSEMGQVVGTSFAVWAPNAVAVRIVGDMNHWDGTSLPMRSMGSSGMWELFVPGIGAGTRYKYEILGQDGARRAKADPMARATEVPPATASIVTESSYEWNDDAWLERRAQTSPHTSPMSVYEVHLGSWRQGQSYRELAEHLVNYVADLGFTHVEFLPVAEHPYGPSWGYQVTGYYAPTSRFGTPDDFRFLVDTLHQAGIGVIVDWVPGHFPKDAFALARFDGMPLYEHPDPRRGDQPDWGTHVFDFGRPQVRNFLVANALFWFEELHIDVLRVDAVASMLYLDYSRKPGEWLPNIHGGRENLEAVQLLQEFNATAYKRYPGVLTIAEESTAWPGVTRPTTSGGLGFGMKWNMGWMHDTLAYLETDPIYRSHHHGQMTFGMVYQYSENFVLPISHDEVVYGKGSLLRKMPGDRWQQLATLRAFLAFMWSYPGKQLLFMGSEFAQDNEWADGGSLDWWLLDNPQHHGVHALVKDLNHTYARTPALYQCDEEQAGFAWLNADDAAGGTFSWVRYGAPLATGLRPALVSITNFTPVVHEGYRLGVPYPGAWREVLNTDAQGYHGSGVGNMGRVEAQDVPHNGQPYSIVLQVPPMAGVWFVPEQEV